MLALGGVVLGGLGQLLQAHQHLAVGAADDVAVHDIHIVYRLTGQRGGECSSSCVLPINTQRKTSCNVHFAATEGMAPLLRPVRVCIGFRMWFRDTCTAGSKYMLRAARTSFML